MGIAVSARATAQGIQTKALAQGRMQLECAQLQAKVIMEREQARERASVLQAEIAALKARCAELQAIVDEQIRLGRVSVPDVRPTGFQVAKAIADEAGYSLGELFGTAKHKSLVQARQRAIYEVHRLCPHLSFVRIGMLFGDRDHSTIIHAIRVWPSKAAKLGIHVHPLGRERSGE